MSRGSDCLLTTGLIIGSLVILATSILTGAILGSGGGNQQFRDLFAEFAAPLGFFKKVIEGSRAFYTDPFSYMLLITSEAKERQGAPIAWWDCDVEVPCLADRIAVRAMRWAEMWGHIRRAQEAGEQPEGLHRTGNWSYAMVWNDRSGECLLHGSSLCEEILHLIANVGLSRHLLAVKVSTLSPGTQLHPHTGPRQDRFRVMLPLVVPKKAEEEPRNEGVKSLGLHVGNRSEELKLGKPLCFNDAVRHTAWNLRAEPRVALLIDLLHPSLSETPLCSTEALSAGSRLCQAACDAFARRKYVCQAPEYATSSSKCLRKCQGDLTWNQQYVQCLESEKNCWQDCEGLKGSRAALLPFRIQTGVQTKEWQKFYYRYFNGLVYRFSDLVLGITWHQSYW
mmetsp:Transcript_8972/g.14915  ORF Transcript_8972/g.14915 Transcript_8972/m.14915 type:complete len:395 (+) Transcript_8972:124-1308(+)